MIVSIGNHKRILGEKYWVVHPVGDGGVRFAGLLEDVSQSKFESADEAVGTAERFLRESGHFEVELAVTEMLVTSSSVDGPEMSERINYRHILTKP